MLSACCSLDAARVIHSPGCLKRWSLRNFVGEVIFVIKLCPVWKILQYGSFQCVCLGERRFLIHPPSGPVVWRKTFFIESHLLGFSTSSIPVPVAKVTLSFFFLSLYFSLIFDLAELNERPVQNPFLPESPPCFDCQFKGWVASRPPLPRRTAGPALFGGGSTFFFLFLFSSCAWLTEAASRARPRGCNEHGRGCRSLWVLRFERNFRRECFFFFLVSVKKRFPPNLVLLVLFFFLLKLVRSAMCKMLP